MIEPFPLHWPEGYPRTKAPLYSRYKATLDEARKEVQRQLQLMGAQQVVISTNLPLRKDGQLYASAKPVINDMGVAIYFIFAGQPKVIACDKWRTIWENMRAIALTVERLRGLERDGCTNILSGAMSGLKELPQHAGESSLTWWQVLEVQPADSTTTITQAYKRLIKRFHPDNPETGNREQFDRVQRAYQEALNK